MTSPAPAPRLSRRLPWPALLAVGLLLLVGGLVEALVRQEQQYREAEETQQAVAEAARVRSAIESELNSTLHLSNGLAAYLKAEGGNVQSGELQAFLAGLFQQGRYLRNIGIAPANRITYVYPLAGNEKALGIHYPDVPSQWPAVERAIRERRPNLAGPLPLLQGGMGLIYRVPVFLENGKYWGMVSTVIKADQLIETIAPSIAQSPLRIALRGKDGLGSQGEVFWGNAKLFDDQPVLMDIAIPYGSWQLAVQRQETVQGRNWFSLLRLAGWSVAAIAAILAFLASRAFRETRRLADSLRQSEDRYRETFEAINDGMWHWNLAAGQLTWDPRCYRLLGYEPCSAAMSREAWLHRMHPADTDIVAAVDEKIARGERFQVEYRLRSRDNRWRWVAMRGQVVAWEDGKPQRVAGTLCDISAAKEAEQTHRASEHRLRALLDALTDLVFVIDDGGRFAEFHAPAQDRHRYPPPSHFVGHRYDEILPAETAAMVREAVTGLFVDGQTRSIELNLPVGEGHERFQATLSRLGEDTDWPSGFLCVARSSGLATPT